MSILPILLVCLLPVAGFAKGVVWEQEELIALNKLIHKTQETIQKSQDTLEKQLHVKELFLKFEEGQMKAMKDPDDKEAMGKMVQTAAELLEATHSANLTHLFSPEFLEELRSYYNLYHNRPHRR